MKFIIFGAGLAIMTFGNMVPAACADAGTGDGHTTVVQDSNGTTVITQSGDPARAEVRVEREGDRTTVYRRSGGNTSVVTQSTNPTGMLPQGWLRNPQER
jgi:hypothetical protein